METWTTIVTAPAAWPGLAVLLVLVLALPIVRLGLIRPGCGPTA